ncbi:hypothetical protein ENUP19_0061G0025 [Entamoeba nuttalli]|uniref:Rab family GTPase n=2 Tax=Entamoeba nuttalli TaxID=412467 RepID=K2G7I2_ENTNP|nr:Rab family GTPase [Entamoeba nuttalli P19]EKE38386.1 Rab family GTPase [Entamoeba nuttalli P19]|eukprot:XP_008859278.1 Rab family GTPase [Entamoeba nuttalli P19]
MTQEPNYVFKILMIGESSVGKTSLVKRYCEGMFLEEMMSTVGIDFEFKELKIGETPVKLQIWDTAGQERFHNVTSSYFRGTHGCIIVYDVNKLETFEKLNYWIEEYRDEQPNSEIIIVGNKIDKEMKVLESSAIQFANTRKARHYLSSAKTGQNVEEIFQDLAESILQNKKLIALLNEANQITTISPIQENSSCC